MDEAVRSHRSNFELAKSTKRYMPLDWLKAKSEAVKEILQSQSIWASYANACLKVLESPVSRVNISKNQIHKVRLSEFRTEQQLLEDPAVTDTQNEFPEGGIMEVTMEMRKRDPELKKQAIARYGYRCQVCDFSFEDLYGELGKGYGYTI